MTGSPALFNISHSCPHCGIKRGGFTPIYAYPGIRNFTWQVFYTCNHCGEAVTFVYIQDTKGRSGNSFMGFNQKPINPMKCVIDPVLDGYDILDFYPRSIENIPENLPQPIEDLFREALGLLNEEQKNAAAMTLRKTLEVALETYAPEFKKKKLGEQIILLASDGRLTPSMKDWAREIKIDGDDGVHEHEPPTLQRNKETAEFTRVLLTYLFTLPAMIEKRRQAREAHKKQS